MEVVKENLTPQHENKRKRKESESKDTEHQTSRHPNSTSDDTGDVNEMIRWHQEKQEKTKCDQKLRGDQQVKKSKHK